MTPRVIILSAPSGTGKTTIAHKLGESRGDGGFSISETTRGQRGREQDGVDYFFLTPEAFEEKIGAAEFVEWARYGDHRYGTLASEIQRILDSGKHAVLDIEIQGARMVRERIPNVVSIFILPPSAEALRDRLAGRSTESEEATAARLALAVDELAAASEYDHVVVNEDLDRAVADVARIIDADPQRASGMADFGPAIQQLRDDLLKLARSTKE
jgi:guanylate kinase